MPEFLGARYESRPLQVISAVIVFVFFSAVFGIRLHGSQLSVPKNHGLEYNEASFPRCVTGVYLVMGGYFAVAVSDFIRGFIEFFGVLTMVLLLVSMKGGLGASFCRPAPSPVHAALHAAPPPNGPPFPDG